MFVLEALESRETAACSLRLGVRLDEIRDISSRQPLSPAMFSAALSCFHKYSVLEIPSAHLVVDVQTAQEMIKAAVDGGKIAPTTGDGDLKTWFEVNNVHRRLSHCELNIGFYRHTARILSPIIFLSPFLTTTPVSSKSILAAGLWICSWRRGAQRLWNASRILRRR